MKIKKRSCLLALLFISHLSTLLYAQELELTYLGAAGWKITNQKTTILIDPYITRTDYREIDFSTPIASDTLLINQIIDKADFILVHHSHPDHMLDVPFIAKRTGAKVIGTESTINILRAYDIDPDQLYTVKGGEDYQFENISMRVIPTLHSALNSKKYFQPQVHTQPLEAPVRYSDLKEGGSLMFLLRINGSEILSMGSMNFIERELHGLSPDILLAGAGASRTEIYNYTERLLTVTNFPKIVIPTHWDNFWVPYGDKEAQEIATKEKLEPFIAEVNATNSNTRTIKPEHLIPFKIEK